MRKTNKLLAALVGTVLAGSLSGCGPQPVSYQDIPPKPQIDGYEDQYWKWDEEDGEWEYEPPGGGGMPWFFYAGALHRSSIRNTPGYKPYSSIKSGSSVKSGGSSFFSSSGKAGGFGSGSGRGGFGG